MNHPETHNKNRTECRCCKKMIDKRAKICPHCKKPQISLFFISALCVLSLSVIATAFWLLGIVIGDIAVNYKPENIEKETVLTAESKEEESIEISETAETATAYDFLIDEFIKRFNNLSDSIAENPMEIDIHDKTTYYRTEFRLPAFDSAFAERYDYNGYYFDVIQYGGYSQPENNNDLRIYLSCDNADDAYQFIVYSTVILAPESTDDDFASIRKTVYSEYGFSGNIGNNYTYYWDDYQGVAFVDRTGADGILEAEFDFENAKATLKEIMSGQGTNAEDGTPSVS